MKKPVMKRLTFVCLAVEIPTFVRRAWSLRSEASPSVGRSTSVCPRSGDAEATISQFPRPLPERSSMP
jgi:hypothetical protein